MLTKQIEMKTCECKDSKGHPCGRPAEWVNVKYNLPACSDCRDSIDLARQAINRMRRQAGNAEQPESNWKPLTL